MNQRLSGVCARTAALLLLAGCRTAPRQARPPAGADPIPLRPPLRESTNSPATLKAAGPGIFDLGKVRLNRAERSVSFPAVLNRASGGMEYFLVTAKGKTHESILRTDVAPTQIHLALLLLSAKGAEKTPLAGPPNEYGGTPGLVLSGDPVTLEIAWRDNDREIRRPAEEVFAEASDSSPPPKRHWVYNGSVVWNGTFLAQESGSVISLIPDPIALINLAGSAPGGTGVWLALADKAPPENVAVQVTIRLTGLPPEEPGNP